MTLTDKTLAERAMVLWPHSEHNRLAWVNAVKRLGDRWLLANTIRKAVRHEQV